MRVQVPPSAQQGAANFATTTIENDTLTIAGCDLSALAAEYGTPLYLYDRATLDASVTLYRRALNAHYGSPKYGCHYPAEKG